MDGENGKNDSNIMNWHAVWRMSRMHQHRVKISCHYVSKNVAVVVVLWRIGLSVIQRNVRRWLTLRNWDWWCLYTAIKPLLNIGRQEDEIKKKLEELEKLKEILAKTEKTKKELEEQNVGLLQTKNDLFFQLQVCNSLVFGHTTSHA